jgi:L-lactate dehydrogenase
MKIGIVGCGHVGSASAFACVMRGVGNELVLVDNDPALAVAQAEDILHATPFAKPMAVSAGSFNALAGCGIVMITAGAAQKPGETRLDLLKRNTDIFASIIPEILTAAPGAILLVASNPVDIMTHITARFAAEQGLEPGRVIGSGTILDTARFRTLLAGHLGVSSHSVHAHVLGEHGDSEVLNWSGANVSNINLANFASQLNRPFTGQVKQQIDEGVRKAAYRIIKGKGATWFGIGAGMARIAKAIVSDENSVITCSVPLKEV